MDIFMAYRPDPGEVIPIENELIRHVRREAEDDNFVLWRGDTGNWVISYRQRNGYQVDAAFGGDAASPSFSRGAIGSLKSFVQLARNPDKVAGEAARARVQLASRERRKQSRMEDQQREYDHLCRFVRRWGEKRGKKWANHAALREH